MENDNIVDADASFQRNQLLISPAATGHLSEAGKWGKFLAIIGFCFIGLFVIVGLFAGTIFASLGQESTMPFSGFVLGLVYIAGALLYFFPILYLFKFAKHLKTAIMTKNPQDLDTAFENLKSHYKYIGIMMIIVLGIYVVFGGGAVLMGALAG
jgi:hypothetical protein